MLWEHLIDVDRKYEFPVELEVCFCLFDRFYCFTGYIRYTDDSYFLSLCGCGWSFAKFFCFCKTSVQALLTGTVIQEVGDQFQIFKC